MTVLEKIAFTFSFVILSIGALLMLVHVLAVLKYVGLWKGF